MPRFDRLTVLNAMVETGLVPVFYHQDVEVAKKVARACAEGGSRILEFTNRGDLAIEVFAQLEKYCRSELKSLILGVGSVVDAPTAVQYINSGAGFVVGPLLNAEVARACNRRKVAYLPGCGSVSEISAAEELGVEIVKIFPGMQVGGPAFVKAVLGPCPWTRIMPTGGVSPTEESLRAWFGAGISCAGIGSELITKDLLKAGDFDSIRARVSETLALIQKVRKN
jgi:2-dehydro-3-deoxyphosphogluconate aldolase/(4S)-4-hydroxy-2-oxoglutarate aldolase